MTDPPDPYPDPAERALAARLTLELDTEVLRLKGGYACRACAKLMGLASVDAVGDAPVNLLLGVVGAVLNVPAHVPCDEFLGLAVVGVEPFWGRLRTLLAEMLPPPLLPVVVDVAWDAVLRFRWNECRLAWLRGVLGLCLGASSSMSLSVSEEASSSSRPARTAGSRGCVVRRISAKRCISSRNRALDIARVE